MRFIIRKWREILVYYITFKKYYFCDHCKKIHKKVDNAYIEIHKEYGMFVSYNCYNQLIKDVQKIFYNIFN